MPKFQYTARNLNGAKVTGQIEADAVGAASRLLENRDLFPIDVWNIEDNESASLHDFLDRLALVSDADQVGAGPGVTLMTIHCAKGLEYPVVLLAGMEENLFPHAMSTQDPDDVEEERRLCYVAMTRAEDRLYLTNATLRRIHGQARYNPPSRFLDEIPTDLIVGRVERSREPKVLPESAWSGGDPPVARTGPRDRATICSRTQTFHEPFVKPTQAPTAAKAASR